MRRMFAVLSIAIALAVTAFAQTSPTSPKKGCCKSCCTDTCSDCCQGGCTPDCCQGK